MVSDHVTFILRYAREQNVDSAELILAMAEIVAIAGATLDLRGTTEQRTGLESRLETFVAHVRERHQDVIRQGVQASRLTA